MLNIKRSSFILTPIVSCLLVIFSNQALAGPKIKGRHITTTCPPCQGIVDDINAVNDDLANVGQEIDEVDRTISVDLSFIQKDQARISSIESMPPSPKKSQELATANKVLKNDQQDLKNHEKTLHDLYDKFYSLRTEKEIYLDDLDDCEYYMCGGGVFENWFGFGESISTPSSPYQGFLFQMMQIQFGLLVGNMSSIRTTHFEALSEDFSGTHTENSADIGLQAKFIFGQPDKLKPTITANAVNRSSATNTIFNEKLSPSSDMNSWVKLENDWIARVLVGLESPTFYDKFTAGLSGGFAVFDQRLKSQINGVDLASREVCFGSSAAANLTYRACPNCLFGHPLSISGQVISDLFPNISAGQGASKVTVNQRWQFSENLVFAIDLDRE